MVSTIQELRPFCEIMSIWKGTLIELYVIGMRGGGYLLQLLNCREKCSPESEKQIGRFFTPAHLHFAAKTNVSPVGQLQIILWPRSKD